MIKRDDIGCFVTHSFSCTGVPETRILGFRVLSRTAKIGVPFGHEKFDQAKRGLGAHARKQAAATSRTGTTSGQCKLYLRALGFDVCQLKLKETTMALRKSLTTTTISAALLGALFIALPAHAQSNTDPATVGQVNAAVAAEAAARAAADTALQTVNTTQDTRLTAVEGVNATQNTAIANLQTSVTTARAEAATAQTAANGVAATANSALTTANAAQTNATAARADAATALSTANGVAATVTSLGTRTTAIEGVNATQNTAIAAIQTLNSTQDSRITVLESLGFNNLAAARAYTDTQVAGVQLGLTRLRRETRQGIAAAMAMTEAPFPSAQGKVSYSASAAAFDGAGAGSVSFAYRLRTQALMAVSGSLSYGGKSQTGGRIGIAGEF